MRVLGCFTVASLIAVLSCGKDSTEPPLMGPPADVAGNWTFSATFGAADVICEDYGTFVLFRSDANLTGTTTKSGDCVGPSGTVNTSGSAALTGTVGAAEIRLRSGSCEYEGNLYHAPVDAADGVVTCRVKFGLSMMTMTGTWSANIDVPPPTISGSISAPPGDNVAVTGERIRITISASDPRGLSWVGYDLGPAPNLADSFAVNDSVVADTIDVIAQASWEGTSYSHVWARNRYGKLSGTAGMPINIVNAVRHPWQSVALGVRAADVAYDPTRNVLYFTEPDSGHVAVLPLSTFTFAPPIPLPMVKVDLGFQSIDLVPGGDTAIVPLPDTSQLALLDRVASTVSTTRLTGAGGGRLLRVTTTRKVLTIGQVDSAGFTFFVVLTHDLTTGRDSIRRDVGQMGHVNATATLWGSPDQSKVLVLSAGAPSCGYVYDAATDAFSACSSFGFNTAAPATASTTGDKWTVGNKVVDGALNLLGTVGFYSSIGISPDGTTGYVPAWYGYDKIALPSGTVLERVRIPALDDATAQRITVFPEGTRLLMWDDAHGTFSFGTHHATVVDLTH